MSQNRLNGLILKIGRIGGLMVDADELDEALVGMGGEEGTRVEASPSQ